MQVDYVTELYGTIIGNRALTRNLPFCKWETIDAYDAGHPSHAGCLAAHRMAWLRWGTNIPYPGSITRGDRAKLIVEDDAVFLPDAGTLLDRGYASHMGAYDMVFLGSQWLDRNQWRSSPITRIRQGQTCRSHAYLITRAAANYLADWDGWDYDVPWTMQSWTNNMKVGLCYPPLAGQAEGRSTIDGMMHSERWWD